MGVSNDFLLRDARELLAKCDDMLAVRHYYANLPLGSIWQNNEPIKRGILADCTSFDEAIARFSRAIYDHGDGAEGAKRAVEWALAQKTFPEASEFAPEGLTVQVNGKRYWHDDFRHHRTVMRMGRFTPGRRGRVVELGAGAGNLARLFKNQFSLWDIPTGPHKFKQQYVIIDLPDTLAFSIMFLRANFPDASWRVITSDADCAGMTEVDFLFVPVGMEYVLQDMRFDAFINTASLGEMRRETVDYWMRFAAHTCDHIFSVNRFLNTVSPSEQAWRLGENHHAFMFDDRWEIIDFELMPDFLRCPWQNRHARQALIFGRRLADAPLPVTDAAASMAAAWRETRLSMTAWEPAINEDLGMTGPLFATWNAYRLHRSEENKTALLRYLAHLRGACPHPFEDVLQLEGE